VKWEVSWMPHAPVGAKKEIKKYILLDIYSGYGFRISYAIGS
jgi:hypothetical protein